jgi:hypothetical protein
MIDKIKKYLLIIAGILIISVIFSIILYFLKLLLGFSQEKFNEIIIAGISQSILSGVILYFIFNEIFVKKPKVRLCVESSIPVSGELLLKFYINNTGDLLAKNILLTAQFENLEILEIKSPNFINISHFRSGRPAIQFDNSESTGILHAYPKIRNSYIGEILFKIKDTKERIEVKYDIIAEQMDFFSDNLIIKI